MTQSLTTKGIEYMRVMLFMFKTIVKLLKGNLTSHQLVGGTFGVLPCNCFKAFLLKPTG